MVDRRKIASKSTYFVMLTCVGRNAHASMRQTQIAQEGNETGFTRAEILYVFSISAM
jgi:hypothetical protein